MKPLQDKKNQREQHHLAGGPRQQHARREPRKARDSKQVAVGHGVFARTLSIVLKETFAYSFSASVPSRAASTRPVSMTLGDAPLGMVSPSAFPACSSQRRKPSQARIEAAATAMSASARCIWITGTPLRRVSTSKRLSMYRLSPN